MEQLVTTEFGCKIINGLGILLWQGAKAFEIWTGQEMRVEYVNEQLFYEVIEA